MNIIQRTSLVGAFCTTLLYGWCALAQDRVSNVSRATPAGIFGDEGQVAISSDAGFSISNTSVSGVDDSTTQVVLRPAVDYFIVRHLSIGGFVGVDHTSAGDFKTTAFSIGPRVGYDFPLSGSISFWPKLGFAFASTTVETEIDVPGPDPDTDESNTSVQLNLFAPFLYHPVDHFFLGLGPALDQDLSGDAKATTIAVRLTLGGWM